MVNKRLHTEASFLFSIARGDEQAFAQLFHAHKQWVYNVAWTYTENKALSEEILQDVFLIIWKNREQLTAIKDLSAYLYTIARNRSLRVLKQLAAARTQDLSSVPDLRASDIDPAYQLSEHRIQELLQKALAILSPQQRKVFELSRIAGLPREEIAKEMGISKATVSVHLTIALRLVRAFLVSSLEVFIVFMHRRDLF
ncbi:MAG TPA: RNA polymerase sigma-70 factor [Chitinophaga sp.]